MADKVKLFLKEILTAQYGKTFVFERYDDRQGATLRVTYATQRVVGSIPAIPYDEKDIGELFYLDLPERAVPR